MKKTQHFKKFYFTFSLGLCFAEAEETRQSNKSVKRQLSNNFHSTVKPIFSSSPSVAAVISFAFCHLISVKKIDVQVARPLKADVHAAPENLSHKNEPSQLFLSHSLPMVQDEEDWKRHTQVFLSFSLSQIHTHTHTHTQRTKAKKTKTVISSMCTFLPYFQTASVPLPLPFPSSFFSLSPPSLCQTFHSAITSLSECNVSTRAYNGTCSI